MPEVARRIYIAGPMAGHPDLNRTAFARAAESIRAHGHDPLNPHDIAPHQHDGPCPQSYATNPDGHSAACYLRAAIVAMLGCESIALLPGWAGSVGARTEVLTAAPCGLPVHHVDRQGAVLL